MKYGYKNFTLSVQEIGDTDNSQVYSKNNIPDYVVLEQSYLDNNTLAYNINRFATSSAYEPSKNQINIESSNPSYNKKNINAFA